MIEDGTFKISELAQALADAPAGQSNALSCLHWAFSRYGVVEPPKEGFHAYDDPDGETAAALISIARAAATFFGYEIKSES